jgi:hypothetical protein
MSEGLGPDLLGLFRLGSLIRGRWLGGKVRRQRHHCGRQEDDMSVTLKNLGWAAGAGTIGLVGRAS